MPSIDLLLLERWVLKNVYTQLCVCLLSLELSHICGFGNFLQIVEKMRPLDQKLKYQIDKLVRTAVTGSLGEILTQQLWLQSVQVTSCQPYLRLHNVTCFFFFLLLSAKNDPLHFRPNPDNLVSKVSDLPIPLGHSSE